MRISLRNENVFDRVIDTSRPAQSHHVPIVDELHPLDRQNENAGLARGFDDPKSMNVRSMLDPRSKAPRSVENKTATGWNGFSGPSTLSCNHRKTCTAEQFAHCRIFEIRSACT